MPRISHNVTALAMSDMAGEPGSGDLRLVPQQRFPEDASCRHPARRLLRCELDAAFFHLYGIAREDVEYILGTFPIVERKDVAAYGEYRTRRVILEVYDAMQRAQETSLPPNDSIGGQPYQTLLDPPSADPRVAHGWETRPE